MLDIHTWAETYDDDCGHWLKLHFNNLEDRVAVRNLVSQYFSRKEKESNMEDYKLRMLNEYKDLKDKYDKLHAMLVKYDAGKLDFELSCPIDLLRKQASVMGEYLYILETRAAIEDVPIKDED